MMQAHEAVIKAFEKAGSRGLTSTTLAESVGFGKKRVDTALKELRASGSVSGPFRDGRSARYFAAKHAPSLKKVEAQLEAKLLDKGLKLSSLSELEESVKGPLKALFKDALATLKSERKIVEFRGPRRSRLFVHCEPLRDQIALDEVLDGHNGERGAAPGRAEEPISLERLRPIYNALKAEQGGISAVKIFDIWKKFGGAKDRLHKLLLDEAKQGRVTLHPATTVNFGQEVMEAGIKLEGQPHPLVTVVFK